MTTLCPSQRYERDSWIRGTGFISRQGQETAIRLVPAASVIEDAQPSTQLPLEERLAQALFAARRAVQNQTRYLGLAQVAVLAANLAALLDVHAWDDDDEVLDPESVTTMVQAAIALDLGLPVLTLARNGNLVGTWSLDDHVLRVEANVNRTVAWTMLYPRGAAPRHEHCASESIDNLVAVVGRIVGRPRGHPRQG